MCPFDKRWMLFSSIFVHSLVAVSFRVVHPFSLFRVCTDKVRLTAQSLQRRQKSSRHFSVCRPIEMLNPCQNQLKSLFWQNVTMPILTFIRLLCSSYGTFRFILSIFLHNFSNLSKSWAFPLTSKTFEFVFEFFLRNDPP